jgi:SMODS-associating 4TM effector domain
MADHLGPAYRLPATASMKDKQNDVRALRLLLAQRKLYSHAKRWSFLRWIGFSVIGVAAPILTVIVPKAAVGLAALAGVWIFLSRTWFSSIEQDLAAKAADVQEQFDQHVFGMPARITRVPTASIEEIVRLTGDDQVVFADATRQRLLDWYPFDVRVDGAVSVAIALAQRQRQRLAGSHTGMVWRGGRHQPDRWPNAPPVPAGCRATPAPGVARCLGAVPRDQTSWPCPADYGR